jgi:hypothetical protein
MNWSRAKEIGTIGGCGLLALAILKRRGGTPLLRYEDGCAVHAAVRLDGELVHLGDDDSRLTEVTEGELRRAVREDFDAGRVNLESGDVRRVLELMGLWD